MSGPGPPEAEEPGEPPAPVTTTAKPTDPALIAEDEDIEFEVGVGSPMSWGTGAGWIVPWGDKILEIGWLKIGEEPNGNGIYDETHLVARALVDSRTCQNVQPLSEATDFSECWEDLYEYPTPYEGGRISAIISDGHRLVVASETDDQIYVSVTSDLDSWDTTEIELPRPSGLPEFVYASSYVDHLAVNPNGWLAKITTQLSIDVLALAGVREPKTGIRSAYELEDDVRSITGDSINFEGLFIEWWLDDERRYHKRQFFSWDDLGISHSMFCHYSYYCSNKHSIRSSNVSGSVWSALWGEEPIRVELPMGFGVDGRCCAIVGTHVGYMAISDPSESGYDPTWFGSSTVFFSPDGIGWDVIDSPSGVFLDLWTISNGIVASSVPLRGDDERGSNWDNIHWWLADSDGSNWREIEEPSEPPMLAPFQYPTIRLASGIVAEPLVAQ